MNRVPDKDVDDTAQPAAEPAGRVEFDSRGNSVWRWARDVLESTSVLLKRLENKDLALEPTQKVPVIRTPAPAAPPTKGAQKSSKPDAKAAKPKDAGSSVRHPALVTERRRDRGGGGGGGFDPYNSR